jgi:hypothetical protein
VGDGSGLTNIAVAFAASATNATNAVNAVSAIFASSATNATNAVSSSFATSATDATNAVNATNATSAVFAASATNATNAVSAVFATSATNATNAINAVSATFATSATDSTNAINAVNATSAVFATSSTDATNAINAINATSAVFATSATNATTAVNVAGGGTVNALSGVFSGIVSVDELDASIGNFVGRVSVGGALNVTGAVSGTSAIFSGDVSIGGLVHIIGKVSASNALFNGMVSVNNFDVNGTATIATATITTGTITTFTATGVSVGASVVCSVLGIGSGATAGQIFGKRLRLNGAAIADIVSLVDAASIAVNFNTAQNFAVMLTGNRTLENPTNCVAGQTGSIFIMQNVSGGKTLSFGSNWKFAAGTAPTLTTTASATDRIDYIVFTSTAIHTVATLDVR